jgi:nitronate monooxygenase
VKLTTPLCARFGVAHPLLNAPMGGGDAPGTLAAAVSNGGGLGMIGGTTAGGARWLVDEIHRARDLTDRPFGVGLLSQRPGAAQLMDAALAEGVRIVAHSFADPTPFVATARDAGALVLCQVRSRDEARRAADAGVDVVAAQGTEAGGHTGRVPTLALLPTVIDAVAPIPVIAAGGIADGRTIAAVLVLGAQAAWIGTRFLATYESGVTEQHKDAVIASPGTDTVLTQVLDLLAATEWPDDVAGRTIRNAYTDEWHGREAELVEHLRTQSPEQLAAERAAARGFWAGSAASFVVARESAADVVAALVADAARVLATVAADAVDDD